MIKEIELDLTASEIYKVYFYVIAKLVIVTGASLLKDRDKAYTMMTMA